MLALAPRSFVASSLVSQLQRTSLFANLPESAVNHFAEKAQVKHAAKGQVLFIQDDEAEWFYLVQSGWVKLFRETLEGAEAVIDVVSATHFFGEHALFTADRYSYSAQVVDKTHLVLMPLSLLRYHLEKTPQMAMNLLRHTAQQRELQSREMEHLAIQTATQRIGCFLLKLCPDTTHGGAQIHLPYDKTLIAARLGMKPETFSRALAKLKSDVNLKINGSTISVASIAALVEYTCNHCSSSFPCDDNS